MLKPEDNERLTRVGPGTPMGALFRSFWLPALLPRELPHPDCDPVRLRLLGEDLVAFRDSDGRIGILHERCPHRRASLYFGRNEACGLRCVYHGWKFDVTGRCLDMPSEPSESSFKDKVRQVAYPAREWGGFVWVHMGLSADTPDADLPPLPELEWAMLPAAHRWQAKWIFESNYAQALEAELDSAHTTFLHRTSVPNDLPAGMMAAAPDLARDGAPRLTVQPTDYGFYYGSRRNAEGPYYWRVTQCLLPSFAIIPMPVWPISCRGYVPIDDETCFVFNTSYNPEAPLTEDQVAALERGEGPAPLLIPGSFSPRLNRANEYGLDRHLQRTRSFTGIVGINNQDRAIVEGMGAICDRENEHLGTSDIAVIAMRKMLLDATRAIEAGQTPQAALDGALYRVRPLDVKTPIADLDTLVSAYGARMKSAA